MTCYDDLFTENDKIREIVDLELPGPYREEDALFI